MADPKIPTEKELQIKEAKLKIQQEIDEQMMTIQERKLNEDKRIKIIPETLEAVITPDFKFKILPHAHTKKITDELVELGDAYEGKEFETEKERYNAQTLRNQSIFSLVLLNGEGKAFTKADFNKWANHEAVGVGAINKLVEKLYIFLVVQGGKVGLGC